MAFDNLNSNETVTPEINKMILELDSLYRGLSNNSQFSDRYKKIQEHNLSNIDIGGRLTFLGEVIELRDEMLDINKSISNKTQSNNIASNNTLDSVITSLKTVTSQNPLIPLIIEKLERVKKSNLSKGEKPKVQEILLDIKKLLGGTINDVVTGKIFEQVSNIEKIYNTYLSDIKRVESDTRKYKKAIVPTEYTDNNDIIDSTWTSIKVKLERAEKLPSEDIISLANEIEINGGTIDEDDWDELFEDFRDGIKGKNDKEKNQKLLEFDKYVATFKKENKELYGGKIGRDVDIVGIGGYLKGKLSNLEKNDKGNIEINFAGLEVEFKSEKGASMYIYKMLLMLDEISTGKNLGTIINAALGYGVDILDIFYDNPVSSVISTFIVVGLARSAWRNFTDVISINIGKKAPKTGIITREAPSDYKGKGLKHIINPLHLHQTIRHWIYNLFKASSDAHQELFAEQLEITIFDSLSDSSGDKYENMKTQMLVLDYYKKKFSHNQDILDKLERLEKTSKFIFGGEIGTDSKTFWIKVFEITRGRGKMKRAAGTLYLDYPGIKQIVVAEVNSGVKNGLKGASALFNVNSIKEGETSLENLTKSDFHINMEANIDLGNFGDEERKKEGLFKKLISFIERASKDYKKDELKQEVARIVDGFLPKFELLEVVGDAIRDEVDQDKKRNLQKLLEVIEKDGLFCKDFELDDVIEKVKEGELKEVLDDYKRNSKPGQKYTRQAISHMEKKGKDLFSQKFVSKETRIFESRNEKISSSNDFKNHFSLQIDMQKIINNIDSSEDINKELKALYVTMIDKGDGIKNDYTQGQINYLVERITSEALTFDNALNELKNLSEADLENINNSVNDKSVIEKQFRDALIRQIDTHLKAIEDEKNSSEKQKLIKELRDRFIEPINGNKELKDFMEKSGSQFRKTISNYERLSAEIGRRTYTLEKEGLSRVDDFKRNFDLEIEMQKLLKNLELNSIEDINNELSKLFDFIKSEAEVKNETYTKGKINYLVDKIISKGITFEEAKVLYTALGEQEKQNLESIKREDVKKNTREKLIKVMQEEIVKIENESDIKEKSRLYELFKSRFIDNIESNSDLKTFLEYTGRDFRDLVLGKFKKLGTKLNIDLRKYVKVEKGEIKGEANKLFSSALSIAPDKGEVISEFRIAVELTAEKIHINELRNVLKAIIVGDIEVSMIETIDFGTYIDESILTEEAKKIDIIEPKELKIYNPETLQEDSVRVTFTENSKLDSFISEYNKFIKLYERIENLERLKIEESELKDRIDKLEGRFSAAISEIAPSNEKPEDISKKIEMEKENLKELKGRIVNSGLGDSLKLLSAEDLRIRLNGLETDIASKFKSNPGFMEFNIKAGIKVNEVGFKSAFETFRAEFGKTVIKGGR